MSIPTIKNYNINAMYADFDNNPGWALDPARCVLLIHDMQNYFMNFYEHKSSIRTQLVANIQHIKKWCKSMSVPCIYTAQPGNQDPAKRALLSDFWGVGLDDDESQTGIVKELQPESGDIVVDKWRYSAFKKNNFLNVMEGYGRNQIIICGVYGHIGILATALEAFMLDFQPFVVANAIADFSKKDHEFVLEYVAGRCGVVVDTAAFTVGQTPLTIEKKQLQEQVAQVLAMRPQDVPNDKNLQDYGLDSIRLMTLMEQWQNMGVNLEFSALMENMTLNHWLDLINAEYLNNQEYRGKPKYVENTAQNPAAKEPAQHDAF